MRSARPAYMAAALLAGIGMGGSRGAVAGLLVLAQIAVLAVSTFDADRMVPGPADRRVGERLRAWLGEFDGPVAVFSDPRPNMVAGIPPLAHRAAAADVLRAPTAPPGRSSNVASPARWPNGGSPRSWSDGRPISGDFPRPDAVLPPLP
ncbi:hypothetical protein [Nonomuraea sp. NPDC048901]|uniref:hypothetical protein n=1 Tax=Nonomuraea sp. NPDC048901 TaxID=3155627 RepID=UPI0034119067